MKAIIPAAGLGTRFLPVTRAVPKEMLPIGAKPALELIVEEAREAGAEEIAIVISPGKELIREYFKDCPGIKFAYQNEQKGLGHAVLQAAEAVRDADTVLILLGDAVVTGGCAAREMAQVSAAKARARHAARRENLPRRGPCGKTAAGGGAERSRGRRALHPRFRDFRLPREPGERIRRGNPADRRDTAHDIGAGGARVHGLRLRRQTAGHRKPGRVFQSAGGVPWT